MADEFALNRAISDGARAEAYLRDDWLKERQQARIAELFNAWVNTAPGDEGGRERLFRQLHEVKKRWDDLERLSAAGRLAQAELNMLNRTTLKAV